MLLQAFTKRLLQSINSTVFVVAGLHQEVVADLGAAEPDVYLRRARPVVGGYTGQAGRFESQADHRCKYE